MKNILILSLLVVTMLILSIQVVPANASILNPRLVHALVTNPVSVFGHTYDLKVDNKTMPVYYGFYNASALVTNILPVSKNNLLQITLTNMTQTDAMWVYIPQAIISADGNNFLLRVDGNETKYELATSDHSTIMGFMVPSGAHLITIQGTSVIPEFPISVYVMAVGFTMLYVLRYALGKTKSIL